MWNDEGREIAQIAQIGPPVVPPLCQAAYQRDYLQPWNDNKHARRVEEWEWKDYIQALLLQLYLYQSIETYFGVPDHIRRTTASVLEWYSCRFSFSYCRDQENRKQPYQSQAIMGVYVRPSRIVGKRELEGVLVVSGAFIPVLFAPGTQPSGGLERVAFDGLGDEVEWTRPKPNERVCPTAEKLIGS